MSHPKKPKRLPLGEKLKVISAHESGQTRNEIMRDFGLPMSTYYKILQDKDVIERKREQEKAKLGRKPGTTDFPHIERCLREWINQRLDDHQPMEGPLLKAQAKLFAAKLGINDFYASNGWLGGFKRRHGFAFCRMQTSVGSTNLVAHTAAGSVGGVRFNVLTNLFDAYDPNDIYCADETGLLFKCLPHEIGSVQGIACADGSYGDERLTVLLGTNITGSAKLPILVVGTMKRSSFLEDKMTPISYQSNLKAWMTRTIFQRWLSRLDDQMRTDGRRIVLLINQCAAHTVKPNLTNVKVMYLPPKASTGKGHPLNHGVIPSFKRNYRAEIVTHLHACLKQNIEPHINLLDALNFIRWAWDTVSGDTILNCLSLSDAWTDILCEYAPAKVRDEVIWPCPMKDWYRLMPFDIQRSFGEYVHVDEALVTTGKLSDDDIVDMIVDRLDRLEDGEEEREPLNVFRRPEVAARDAALDAIHTLHKYFDQCADVDRSIYDKLYELEKYI